MSWHFSQEQGAEFWAHICSEPESSQPSSETSSQEGLSSKGNETSVISSRFGTTAEHSMDELFGEWWISSLRASRANRSRSRARKKPEATNAMDGLIAFASCEKYGQQYAYWRTCRGYYQNRTVTLDKFSGSWPKAGMMLNGVCCLRPKLALAISGSDSGSWPTPCATEPVKCLFNWREKIAKPRSERGGGCGPNLATAVMMFPTPTATEGIGGPDVRVLERRNSGKLRDLVALLPTPTVNDSRGGRNATAVRSNAESQHHPGMTLLDAVVPVGEKLSPDWTEWFMFWPVGWTHRGKMSRQTFHEWLQTFQTALRDCVP